MTEKHHWSPPPEDHPVPIEILFPFHMRHQFKSCEKPEQTLLKCFPIFVFVKNGHCKCLASWTDTQPAFNYFSLPLKYLSKGMVIKGIPKYFECLGDRFTDPSRRFDIGTLLEFFSGIEEPFQITVPRSLTWVDSTKLIGRLTKHARYQWRLRATSFLSNP